MLSVPSTTVPQVALISFILGSIPITQSERHDGKYCVEKKNRLRRHSRSTSPQHAMDEQSRRTYHVHAKLLRERCPYLSRLQDEVDHALSLHDEKPDAFESYLPLLYTGEVAVLGDDERPKNENNNNNNNNNSEIDDDETIWTNVVDLYTLARKLEDLKSTNLVTDELVAMLRTASPPARIIDSLYRSDDAAADRLRKLFSPIMSSCRAISPGRCSASTLSRMRAPRAS
ncbi:Hypothetical predicted protein [Lecanosticta acicola]|uniref:Uncharacterized protein n=1 Tax=Lecanosticta acicola TaxID=111012 RepID=A0AAI9E434_9PEZI|nr:Hypothetical predicted protein [Lecanosticta acicola]